MGKSIVAQAMIRRITIFELLLDISDSLLHHEYRDDLDCCVFDGKIPNDLSINIEFSQKSPDENEDQAVRITAKCSEDSFGLHWFDVTGSGKANSEAIIDAVNELEKKLNHERSAYNRFMMNNSRTKRSKSIQC